MKGLNGSGRSPAALSIQKLRELGVVSAKAKKMPTLSIHTVTVPGAAAGTNTLPLFLLVIRFTFILLLSSFFSSFLSSFFPLFLRFYFILHLCISSFFFPYLYFCLYCSYGIYLYLFCSILSHFYLF